MKGMLLIGNPLLDFLSHVDESFLQRYNLKRADAALCDVSTQFGIFDELASSSDVKIIPGGSALNSARVMQWMIGSPKGFVHFVGCIGDGDTRGQRLVRRAESEGVMMHCEKTSKAETGCCAVCVVDHDRSLLAFIGAAGQLSCQYCQSLAIQDVLNQVDLVYASGFVLTVTPDGIEHLAHAAHADGKRFGLNLSAPWVLHVFRDAVLHVLPLVDLLFGNEHEFKALADILNVSDQAKASAENMMRCFQSTLEYHSECEQRVLVMTEGSEPTIVIQGHNLHTFPVEPVPSKCIVDLNGAGDAFVGGFLAEMRDPSSDLEAQCRAGHYAASIIIQQDGCTLPPHTASYS